MKTKIGEKITNLIQELYDEGYSGHTELNRYRGYSGANRILPDGILAVRLTGFCKEDLFLVQDVETNEVVGVGRYDVELRLDNVSVLDIVKLAWKMFKSYEARGYDIPEVFKKLFFRYGYIEIEEISIVKTSIKGLKYPL